MVFHMKTTLSLPDPLMRQLKEEAARQRVTMSTLVEAALRGLLTAPETWSPSQPLPPLPSWDSGGAWVDVSDREALDAVLNEDQDALYRRTRSKD